MPNPPLPTIGVAGLGAMGSRMAQRLLNAGYRTLLFNRTRPKAKDLESQGATFCPTPRDLAAKSDIILSCLTDDAAVESIYQGENGILSALRPSSIILEASTIHPSTSRKLHQSAAAKNARMLDCPVSGSTPQVEKGELIILVGGDAQTFHQCEPIFRVLGKAHFHIGPAGSGSMMKLVVNGLMGVGMQALAEAVTLGQKGGIPLETLLDVLAQLAVVSPSQKAKMPNIQRGEYPPMFQLKLMHKDLGLVTRTAAELSVPVPATAAAHQMFSAAKPTLANEDFSAIAQFLHRLAAP